jgi:dihydroxyacetone kinase-like predicted kinase
LADPSLLRFRLVIEAALAQLESRREEINDLNVFPVADGDTGDNMALTLRAVLDELDNLSTQGEIDEIGREQIVNSVARARPAARELGRHPLAADPRRRRGADLTPR